MNEENAQKTHKRSRKEIIELVIFMVVAISLAYGVNVGIRGYSGAGTSLVIVETGSMQPTLLGIYIYDAETHTTHWSPFSGDELYIKKVAPTELQLGDIIVFEDPRGGEIPIVHRIVEKYEKDGIYYFRTTGDNPWTNAQVDWWEIPQGQVIGKVIARIPRIGYFHLSIQTRLGRMVLLFAIVLLIASMFLFPDDSEESQDTEPQKETLSTREGKSQEKKNELTPKNLVYALLILFVIIIPVLANTMEVMSHQTETQILSVDIRSNPRTAPQLSVKISLWSGGYLWNVLDSAAIHINGHSEPEYVWNSPYRWRGTKIIAADFFIELDVPQGTLIGITLKTYFHNGLGARWVEEVSTTIPAS